MQQHFLDYTERVHRTTTAAYALAKLIFLMCLPLTDVAGREFLSDLVNRDFFKQVWLVLTTWQIAANRGNQRNAEFRNLINDFRVDFLDITGFQLQRFACHDQTATYESVRMEAAYINMLQANFGTMLRRVVNTVLNIKAVTARIRQRLQAANLNDDQILQFIRENITTPANAFKDALVTGVRAELEQGNFGNFFNGFREDFGWFFDSYRPGYIFGRNSVYYDVIVNPSMHMKAYIMMAQQAQLLSEDGNAPFQCCPLRSARYPLYTQIDTRILCTEFLGLTVTQSKEITRTLAAKRRVWNAIFNLNLNNPNSSILQPALQRRKITISWDYHDRWCRHVNFKNYGANNRCRIQTRSASPC